MTYDLFNSIIKLIRFFKRISASSWVNPKQPILYQKS